MRVWLAKLRLVLFSSVLTNSVVGLVGSGWPVCILSAGKVSSQKICHSLISRDIVLFSNAGLLLVSSVSG